MALADQLAQALLQEAGKSPQCAVHSVLITEQGCIHCQTSKKELVDQIDSGQIQVLDTDSEEAQGLMAQAGVDLVPQLFIVDCNGDLVKDMDMEPPEEVAEADATDNVEADIMRGIKRFVSGRS